jgi:rhodanese-related sulfurtransferase
MANQPNWVIQPQQLMQELSHNGQSKALTLLDVRDEDEVQESKIDGSVWIPLDEIQNRAEVELDKEANIVVYCAHGVRSLQAVMAMRMMGFQKLRSLEGGIVAWQEFQNKN